jgi:hypothetical protein
MLVEITQYCFQLEDMSDITPFWDWIDRRIRPETHYTEPEDFEPTMKGLKKADEASFLITGEPRRAFDNFCIVSATYRGDTVEILDIDAKRLGDHRYKVELTIWEPEGWPKKSMWDYFNSIVKDLSHDFPDVKTSIRNSILGFKYEELTSEQKLEMLGIEAVPDEIKSISPMKVNKTRKPPGRKHLYDDIWAWREVNQRHREPSMVYKEWITRPGVIIRNLQDSSRMFKLITKPDWLYGNKL